MWVSTIVAVVSRSLRQTGSNAVFLATDITGLTRFFVPMIVTAQLLSLKKVLGDAPDAMAGALEVYLSPMSRTSFGSSPS